MNGNVRFVVFTLAIVLAAGLVGCGSTSDASKSSSSASVPSGTSEASPPQAVRGFDTASSESDKVEVDSKYLGHWTGYDIYTQDTVDAPVLMTDLDMSATLDVDADGTVSVEMVTNGEHQAFKLRMVEGKSGNGYTLYDDENGRVDGALNYGAKNGPVSWLVFSEYGSDGILYSFTFYQED